MPLGDNQNITQELTPEMNIFTSNDSGQPGNPRRAYTITGIVALVLFALMTFSTAVLESDWAYVCLTISCVAAYVVALSEFPSGKLSSGRPLLPLFIGMTSVALLAFAFLDTSTERWQTAENYYIDTYGRWSGKHLYRDVKDFQNLCFSEGRMGERGKPHGIWKWHSWNKSANVGRRFQSGTDYYWHGVKVTEGEWRRRVAPKE